MLKKYIKLIAIAVGGIFFAVGAKLLSYGYDWREIVKRHDEWRDTIPDDKPRKLSAWN